MKKAHRTGEVKMPKKNPESALKYKYAELELSYRELQRLSSEESEAHIYKVKLLKAERDFYRRIIENFADDLRIYNEKS
jgi:hypothetical protein